jgi:hypothetical protein
MAGFLARLLRSQRESPVHGRASIYYEPKGVRSLILTFTLRIVLNFFGTIVATLRIHKIR